MRMWALQSHLWQFGECSCGCTGCTAGVCGQPLAASSAGKPSLWRDCDRVQLAGGSL